MLLLNDVARAHGVGRVDMVENRFVGIKSRGVYETPGPSLLSSLLLSSLPPPTRPPDRRVMAGGTVLFEAHADLEGVVLDREVRRLRDTMALEYCRLVIAAPPRRCAALIERFGCAERRCYQVYNG